VAEQNEPSEVRVGSGTGGVVTRVHGDVWVFRLSP
jgi:predicted trehalose synthase